jgi:hypothetical protein
MTVARVTTDSYDSTGFSGTRKDNEMTAEVGLWLATPDFLPTFVQLATESYVDAAIKAEQLFPIPNIDSYETRDKEDTIYESPGGNEKLLLHGKRRKTYQLDLPLSVHRALQSFNNANLRQYRIHDDGKISFYENDTFAQGFTTSMIQSGMMKDVPADGSTPAFTPFMINLSDYREWDAFGGHITPSWNALDKEGLAGVILETTGTPTTSEVIVKVYSADGYDADGAVKEVLIKGIIEADFVSGFGTQATMVDNADGTYTFASSAAFSTGIVNLKVASAMASTGLLIQSTGAGTVTIA